MRGFTAMTKRVAAITALISIAIPLADPPSKWWTPLISSYWSWKGV